MDFIRSDSLDRSRKLEALQSVMAKLTRTRDKLEKKIAATGSAGDRRRLEIKLMTNRRQRDKAAALIADFDQGGRPKRHRTALLHRRALFS